MNTREEQSPVPGNHDVFTSLRLEGFLSDRPDKENRLDPFVEREIERLISCNKYQLAYDMYGQHVENAQTYDDFVGRYVGPVSEI